MFEICFPYWRKITEFLSSEWVLTRLNVPNGGSVIIMRSILSSALVFLLIIAILNFIDPSNGWSFSFHEFRMQIIDRYAIYGVIFAGTYTLLYARYSSQWTYLADLYNRIKETESSNLETLNSEKLAEWKAGFIEDADLLHLVCKSSFVSAVKTWGQDNGVRHAFLTQCRGGEPKFNEIMSRVDASIEIIEHNIKRLMIRPEEKSG